jgi:hypothetical protein
LAQNTSSFKKIRQHMKIQRKPNKDNISTMVKDLVNCNNYLCMTFAYDFVWSLCFHLCCIVVSHNIAF